MDEAVGDGPTIGTFPVWVQLYPYSTYVYITCYTYLSIYVFLYIYFMYLFIDLGTMQTNADITDIIVHNICVLAGLQLEYCKHDPHPALLNALLSSAVNPLAAAVSAA